MGISMLGSLVTAILEGLNKVFTGLFNWLIKLVLDSVIAPLLQTIISLIANVVCYLFYEISVFLLALVDFVEVLFRVLAGLDTHGAAELQYNGKSGDVLIQLITSEEVTQAFLAMCIVGLFLLVITTIFQMIKVEYTTEGSHNAKGPILEKAFKGVANLMLLPLLVVFGIFIGNQILDLIDTATSGSNTASISGLLFVTAASDAVYSDGVVQVVFDEDDILNPVGKIMSYTFETAWDSDFEIDLKGDDKTTSVTMDKANIINNAFMNKSEGYKYYKLTDVSKHYNFTKINYVVLIFATCIVIKTLYNAAFGMVSRLYYCVALYIVSPMVIGVSPVMEKSFSSWRSKFLGKVISAYGVVISLNIFFIVIRLLLNIDITFTNLDSPFVDTFMSGLIKAIFVIAGSLLIEKLSGEFAGFFGGEDALATGKSLSQEVGKEATKAITTAATGAAMIGTGGAAALSGIGKVGHGIASGVKAMGSGISTGIQNAGPGANLGHKIWGGVKGGVSTAAKGGLSAAKSVGGKVADAVQTAADYAGVGGIYDKATHLIPNLLHKGQFEKAKKDYENATNSANPASQAVQDAAKRKMAEAQAKVAQDNANASHRGTERIVRESSRDYIAKQGMNKMKPKFMEELTKMKADGEEKGTALSKKGKAAYDTVKEERKKDAEKKYESLHVGEIKANNFQADKAISMRVSGELSSYGSLLDKYDDTADKLTDPMTDPNLKPILQNQLNDMANEIKQKLGMDVQMQTNGRLDRSATGMNLPSSTNLTVSAEFINKTIQNSEADAKAQKDLSKYIKDQFKTELTNRGVSQDEIKSILSLHEKTIERLIKEDKAKAMAEGKK